MSVTTYPIKRKMILSLFCAVVCSLMLLMLPLLVQANVDLLYFRAVGGTTAITLEWETASELDNLGFNLYRSATGNWADRIRLNSSLIPSQVGGQPIGAFYQFPDSDVVPDTVYTYWLEDVDFNGNNEVHDPVEASLVTGNTIPTQPPPPAASTATATSTRTPTAAATATTSTGTNATATATRTPAAAATTVNTSLPTATVAAGSQNQAQPTATRSPATTPGAASSIPSVGEGYPAPEVGDQDQPPAPEENNQELAPNRAPAATAQGVAAANQLDSESQSQTSAALSVAPIGSGSQPPEVQEQSNSIGNTDGLGLPVWLVILLVGGLLLAVAASAATLFVLNQKPTK